MMKDKENTQLTGILAKADRRTGMTLPEGYFEEFVNRMQSQLPEAEWEKPVDESTVKRSVWQQVRPYVYLAAMFAGVWCMMQMFGLGIKSSSSLSVGQNPELTQALNDQRFVEDYVYETDYPADDSELMDNLYQTGFNPEESASN